MNPNGEHVTALQLHHAVLDDVQWVLGDYVTCKLRGDIDEIHSRVRTRGWTLLMDVLPDLCKTFEQGLDTGHFPWDAYPNTLRRKGSRCPEDNLFGHLIGLSFSALGVFSTTPDLVAATRMILLAFKKVKKDSPDEAKLRAAERFKETDLGLPQASNYWTNLSEKPRYRNFADLHDCSHPHDVRLALEWADVVKWYTVPDVEFDFERAWPKHGPGAVSDVGHGGDKYLFPSWSDRLDALFPLYGWGLPLYGGPQYPEYGGTEEPRAKLICVPKTLSKPRVIASEPAAHQYCQQAVLGQLRDSMRPLLKATVDFRSQEKSRDLLTSRDPGSYATMDLSEASDRVTTQAVECLFSGNHSYLDALRSVRTHHIDINGEVLPLNKFGAMGSAVTFPVQSMLFSTLAIACVALSVYGPRRKCATLPSASELLKLVDGNVRVFGDDIIVPPNVVGLLALVFEVLHLRTNMKKTFYRGLFRESCGMDVYDRREVTPLYFMHLSCEQKSEVSSWVEVSNNAYRKGLWSVARTMRAMLPQRFDGLIPSSPDDLPSLRYFTFLPRSTYPVGVRKRWDKNLHRFDVKGLVVATRRKVECRNTVLDLTQYFVESRKRQDLPWLPSAPSRVGISDGGRTGILVRWVPKA